MKERPILFNGPMVRAILSGQKTQTRRVVKNVLNNNRLQLMREQMHVLDPRLPCPYGQPGDRLWVRESWGYRGSKISTAYPGIQKVDIDYRADGQRIEYERPANDDSSIPKQRPCREDENYIEDYYNGYLTRYWKQWRPSIHMPRWACRIVLEIVSVRVERLQGISLIDAEAEGIVKRRSDVYAGDVDYLPIQDGEPFRTPVEAYRALWESINGPESWNANPWVWVVEFKRVQQ